MQNLFLAYYVVCNLTVSVKCYFQLDSLNGDITRTEDCLLPFCYMFESFTNWNADNCKKVIE